MKMRTGLSWFNVWSKRGRCDNSHETLGEHITRGVITYTRTSLSFGNSSIRSGHF
jgi:hypothetical protein